MGKDCGGHDHDDCECCPIRSIFAFSSCSEDDVCESSKIRCIVASSVVGLAVLFGFIVLVIYLILHPSKPQYELDGTTVSNLTLSDNCFLSVTVQITLTTRNPNDRVGIYYDKLDVYAVYKEQQITVPALLPARYMGHEDVAVWSPYLIGTDVPATPGLAAAFAEDEAAGMLLINVKVDGTLRWKVGSWVSAHYHIFVNCPAFLTVDNGNGNGNGVGPARYHFQQMSTCSVEV